MVWDLGESRVASVPGEERQPALEGMPNVTCVVPLTAAGAAVGRARSLCFDAGDNLDSKVS